MARDVREILQNLIDTPPAARPARLAELCSGDEPLRREVLDLLSYAGQSGDLLDSLGMPGLAFGEPPPALPDTIGPWRIEAQLGWGATGIVYRARRDAGESPAALKVFRGGLPTPDSVRRFHGEARALARLSHPGIPALVDSGVLELPTGSVPFVATAIVEGRSLRQVMADGRMAPARALELVRALAAILEYAHAQHVIHRDLKPDNILIDAGGHPHVLDFGLARLVDPDRPFATRVTRLGQIIGTIPYMSPEQAQATGQPVDTRSDLYALGVIAYELLAGRLPYDIPADSLHQAIVAILTAEPRPLGAVEPACRGAIESIVHRLLAKRPDDRYASAAALRSDLERQRAGKSVRKPRARAAPGRRPVTRVVAVSAAVTAVAIAAASGFRVWNDSPARVAARERTAVAAAVGDVTVAYELVHLGPRTQQTVTRALQLLTSAHEQLNAVSHNRGYGNLTLYVLGRKAEAHGILGAMNWDIEQLRSAKASLGLAWGYGDKPISIPLDLAAYPAIANFQYNELATGMASAELALGELETPLAHAQLAVQDIRDAPRGTWASYRAAPEGSELAGERHRFHCLTLAASARAYLARGRLTGSLADIDTALAHGQRADRMWNTPSIPWPQGSMVHTLGETWMARAVIGGAAAERDSAHAAFERALGYRAAQSSPSAFRTTHAALVRLAVLDAHATRDPRAQHERLAAALDRYRLARSLAPAAFDSLREACDRVLEAELLTALAAAGDAIDATVADSNLAMAERRLVPSRFPLQYAETMRVRAARHALRWRDGRNETERSQTIRCLRTALEIVTAADDPQGHARLRHELTAIESGVRLAAGTASHVVSDPDRAPAATTPAPTSTASAPSGRNAP